MTSDVGGPLRGVRVVDLTSTFMGPYSTMLLGQWGADVIKIEPPAGDIVRNVGARETGGMGPMFLNTNRGKRSVVLDLKHPGAAEVVRRLVETCDIFVHNMRPSVAVRLSVTAADVQAVNPRCVYLGFRGFAAGGPYENDPAYDDIIQAASGLAAIQGSADNGQYVRSSIADKIVGLMGAAAVLAALHARDQSQAAPAIEIPMFEAMVGFNLLEQQGGRVFVPPSGPTGYARTSSEFRRPYRTKDGHVGVMMYTDAQWRSFFRVIGRDDLVDDDRFATIRARTLNADDAYGIVDAAMAERTTAEWLDLLKSHDLAASRVNSIDDLFADAHLQQTEFFRLVDHPSEGSIVLPGMIGPIDGGAHTWLAPGLGEHTDELLSSLGYARPEIEALRADGVVG